MVGPEKVGHCLTFTPHLDLTYQCFGPHISHSICARTCASTPHTCMQLQGWVVGDRTGGHKRCTSIVCAVDTSWRETMTWRLKNNNGKIEEESMTVNVNSPTQPDTHAH